MGEAQTSHELPEIGKISPEIFEEVIYPRLGRRDRSVLVPPQHGVDIGVIDIGGGQVMAFTCDPVFVVPAYGWESARRGSRSTSLPPTRRPRASRRAT